MAEHHLRGIEQHDRPPLRIDHLAVLRQERRHVVDLVHAQRAGHALRLDDERAIRLPRGRSRRSALERPFNVRPLQQAGPRAQQRLMPIFESGSTPRGQSGARACVDFRCQPDPQRSPAPPLLLAAARVRFSHLSFSAGVLAGILSAL